MEEKKLRLLFFFMIGHTRFMKNFLTIIILLGLIIGAWFIFTNKDKQDTVNINQEESKGLFQDIGLQTNTTKTLIPLDEVLGGGPAKDGIPAISTPKFKNIAETDIPDETLGVLVKGNEGFRYYPYTVLVWHEIVNDTIDGKGIAVTFCPLCGSSIVYERSTNGTVHEFGVSGKLWQSNLLMYDKATESLWSQIEGRAVVGDLIGSELEIYPSDIVTWAEAKNAYPNLQVLSDDTGYNRDYGFYPYGNYDDSEDLIFPINNLDTSLPAKTLMYASVINEEPIAFVRERLLEEKTASIETDSGTLTASVNENNEITLVDTDGNTYPGYVTMWFSWANHNDGPVWQ